VAGHVLSNAISIVLSLALQWQCPNHLDERSVVVAWKLSAFVTFEKWHGSFSKLSNQ
jgi:hypothetical protein